MREIEIMMRQVNAGQRSQSQTLVMTVFEPDDDSPFKQLRITACPDWLETKCKCGAEAYPSKFFKGGTATLVQIDNEAPVVMCDKCRENLVRSTGKRILMTKDIPPSQDRLMLRGRVEWSVNGDRWYSVKHSNIKPYSTVVSEKRLLIMKANTVFNKLNNGGTIKGKAKYDKETKILELNIDSFD